jgi:hypothetical protein
MPRAILHRRQPEKSIQHQIAGLLRTVGARVYNIGTRRRKGDFQGTMQTPGIPDVLAILPFRVACLAAEACGRGVYHILGGLDDVIAKLCELHLLREEQVPHYRRIKDPS